MDGNRQVVVGDIGSTYARFGIADLDALSIGDCVRFECSQFGSADDVLAAYLTTLPDRPRSVSLAVAGPVVGDGVEMTNLPWTVTRHAVARLSGAERVCLVNDFQATALSLPHLGDGDVMQVGGPAAPEHATKVVLGPGTGLGVAALAWTGRHWAALSGEGGHMAFAAQTDEDFEVVSRLGRDIGYVAYEHMLSGPGLVRLHRLLQKRPSGALSAPEIIDRALTSSDAAALQTLQLFFTWLGQFAGDIALFCGASGGVYLAGGIAPRIPDFLYSGYFRPAFEAKGQLTDYLAAIPVFVIKTGQAGLLGAAIAFADMLDADGR